MVSSIRDIKSLYLSNRYFSGNTGFMVIETHGYQQIRKEGVFLAVNMSEETLKRESATDWE